MRRLTSCYADRLLDAPWSGASALSSAASSGHAERSGWLRTRPPWMAARMTVAMRVGSADASTSPRSRILRTPSASAERHVRMPSAITPSSSGSLIAACVAREPIGQAQRPRPM